MTSIAWHRFALAGLLAVLVGGCATAGKPAAPGEGAAAFVAPDGARATPNTGASRLADGIGAGIDVPAGSAPGGAGTTAPAAASSAGGEGVVFVHDGGGSTVSLAGDFNNWSADADPMARQADGSFRLVKKLEPGRYAYKFVVDGQWTPDPQAKETVDDGFGGKNSIVVVGAGTATAAPAPAPAAPAAAPAPAGAGGAVFTYSGPGSSVNVAGEFNGWDMNADPMTKQADGSFRLVKNLDPGRYAYKFVVDGQWTTDPDAKETVDDGFGGKNAVLVVATASPTAKEASEGTPSDIAVNEMLMPVAEGDLPAELPVVLSRVAPVYPDDALKSGVEGIVVVEALIGIDGKVSETKITQRSNPVFQQAAEDAVRKWLFKPALTGDGKPQAIWMQIPIRFALGETTPSAASANNRAPEITAEGVRFTFPGAARSVHLAGDFNEWSPTADPLTRGADGAWTIVRKLPPGTHAYKFVVDGTTWKTDLANPASVDDGFGGKNSIVTVP